MTRGTCNRFVPHIIAKNLCVRLRKLKAELGMACVKSPKLGETAGQ